MNTLISVSHSHENNVSYEDVVDWNPSDIYRLQKAVIKQSLREIGDQRRSTTMRREALDWLMSNDVHPFSAIVCCQAHKLDLEHLRMLVAHLVKDLN
ncbi:hypothetical protein [Photobacterium leiognathi]|uniref:hypothetical protein n=1 Tax=Photobacterium leiognathi TaxID=553611 RepID=UPI00273A2416|nr:hypothetical protein [Photobacterium leiognathi]